MQCIYKRVIKSEIVKGGKSLALATAKHLKALIVGTDEFDEIISMGVLTPEGNPYNVPKGVPFSFPIIAKNGYWKIMEVKQYL